MLRADRRLQLASPVGARAAQPLAVPPDPALVPLELTPVPHIPGMKTPTTPRASPAATTPASRSTARAASWRGATAAGSISRAGWWRARRRRAPARLRLRRRHVRRDGARRLRRGARRRRRARSDRASAAARLGDLPGVRLRDDARPRGRPRPGAVGRRHLHGGARALRRGRSAAASSTSWRASARPAGSIVISVPIETGPSLAGKQFFRALAGLRGLGDYAHRERYSPVEMLRAQQSALAVPRVRVERARRRRTVPLLRSQGIRLARRAA